MRNFFIYMFCSVVAVLILSNGISSAQAPSERITIRGKVTDKQDKQPVIGASVVELDKDGRTISGISTDIEGNFVLRISNPEHRVAVSFIGYRTSVNRLNGRTVLNIALDGTSNELSDVIITGKKQITTGGGLMIEEKNITGAITRVQGDDLKELSAQSIDQALQGRMPGVDFGTTSGDPGSGMSIRIRGTASLSGNSNPLIVVDDMPFETSIPESFDFGSADEQGYAQLLNIAPSDIAEITVLKDAASTAVWGSRAANGVLVIRTKRGVIGKPLVTYTFRGTMNKQPKAIPLLTGDQFSMLVPEMVSNSGGLPLNRVLNKEFGYDPNDPYYYSNYSNNTSWIDEITQTGLQHDHNLSMTGGGQKAKYYASVGYLNSVGTTKGTSLDRITSKVNLDYTVSQRIRFRTDIAYTYSNNPVNFTDRIRDVAYQKMPNMAVYEYDEYGNKTPVYFSPASNIQGQFGFDGNNKVTGTFNPLAMANEGFSKTLVQRVVPKFNIRYDLIPNLLTTTFDLQLDINSSKTQSFLPQIATGRLTTETFVNRATDSDWDGFDVQSKLNFLFNPRLPENHSFTSLLSFQTKDEKNQTQYSLTSNTASSLLTDPSIPSRAITGNLTSGESQYRTVGVLLNGQYGYKDRYILNASIRMDGNSRFGPENRYGYFPSLSGRWHIGGPDGESFLRGLTFMDDLSLRASWGLAGKTPSKDYLFYNTYNTWGWTYQGQSGVYPSSLELSNLKWETLVGENLGFNLALFNYRIRVDAEIYKNRTKDLIFDKLQLPYYTGYNQLMFNVGTMDNNGWELMVNTIPVKSKNWIVGVDFNIAQNLNVVKSVSEYYPTENATIIGENGKYKTYLQVGNPFGSFYGFRFKGVYKDEAATIAKDASGQDITGPNGQKVMMRFNYPLTDYLFQPGDAMYEDINYDGNIDYKDIVYLGNSIPKVTGGFGFNVTYKGDWKLQTFFNYRLNYDMINGGKMNTTNMYSYNNQSTAVLSRWRNPGDETDMPRALFRRGYNWLGSDRYVEDASFVRLRSVTLRYALKKSLADRLKIKNANIYVTAENLYTWTKYTGQDPDVSIKGNTDPFKYAQDNSLTPPTMNFVIGFSAGF
ncbi:SusC/RagA family TonB-linked outer membrane protein [Arcticibacter sp.]|uniref:SusC/RagA family TonB-linked outer membrane protein n=1 Tax=Arcticibacter sp. TaxID=1872630 RepID=UPI00388D007A